MKFFFSILILFSSNLIYALLLNSEPVDNSLVIYNSNIGLVYEKRELNLKKDEQKIIYEGVASSINTDSVKVTLPDGVKLFSQQYRFDKLTRKKLLDAYVGLEVDVRVKDDDKRYKTVTATLLSSDGATSIVKEFDGSIISVDSKNIIFSKIPKRVITKPSLVWSVNVREDVKSTIKIDYLINRIGCKSSYILDLHRDRADLSGWITIDNRSGKSFNYTKLYLLAGDINRAGHSRVKSMAVRADSLVVAHKAYEGYHLFSIPFRVDLADNEKTSLKFITKKDLKIKREYRTRMSNPTYLIGEVKRDVTQSITLSSLDIPLPKGVVRTYSKLDKTTLLLAETYLNHTPKDTKIRLKIGKNFDIKVKETLLNIDKGTVNIDRDVEYSLKNSSDESKIVEILVPFNKLESSEVSSDEKFTYTKGNLVTFKVEVKANSAKEFEVRYRVKKSL